MVSFGRSSCFKTCSASPRTSNAEPIVKSISGPEGFGSGTASDLGVKSNLLSTCGFSQWACFSLGLDTPEGHALLTATGVFNQSGTEGLDKLEDDVATPGFSQSNVFVSSASATAGLVQGCITSCHWTLDPKSCMQIEVGWSSDNQNQRSVIYCQSELAWIGHVVILCVGCGGTCADFLLHPVTSSSMLFAIKFCEYPAFFSPANGLLRKCPHASAVSNWCQKTNAVWWTDRQIPS